MRVILLKDVNKVGKKGEIVKVSDGYGQNYLSKNKLAVLSTEAGKAEVAKQKEAQRLADLERKKDAEELAKKLEDITLEFKVKTGKEGRVFGSISTKQIVNKLQNEYQITVDKRKFVDASPVAELGVTKKKIELYTGVIGTISVELVEK